MINIADLFHVTVDTLIRAGEPTEGEAHILNQAANGNPDIVANCIDDVVQLAPLLKPSVLDRLAANFKKDGIDLSHLVALAEYLSGDTMQSLMDSVTIRTADEVLLSMLLPFLDTASKAVIFEKILSHELDWRLIKPLLPHAEYLISQIEAAVMDGALPSDALSIVSAYVNEREE